METVSVCEWWPVIQVTRNFGQDALIFSFNYWKEAPIIIPRYFNCLTSGLPVDSTVFLIVSFRRSANLAQFILYPEILPKLAKIVKMLCMDCNALPKLKWTSSTFIWWLVPHSVIGGMPLSMRIVYANGLSESAKRKSLGGIPFESL